MALEDDTLTLGYGPDHEPIRRRCEERMDRDITKALVELFGRQNIKCRYVPISKKDLPGTVEKHTEYSNGLNPAAPLSSAERAELARDPNVKAVLDFFDGSITDVRRTGSPSDDASREG